MGCSTQVVPSWSKVAIRSSGDTKFGLLLSVVVLTKFMIACLAGPSFHEGNGSAPVAATGLADGAEAEGAVGAGAVEHPARTSIKTTEINSARPLTAILSQSC